MPPRFATRHGIGRKVTGKICNFATRRRGADGARERGEALRVSLNPGVVWAHNDSGDRPRFFALDEAARLRAEVAMPAARAIDWEDIAVGPCPTGSCVFLGDIGDNARALGVRRLPRPGARPRRGPLRAGGARRADRDLPLRLPRRSARRRSALLVHPSSGDVYVITKEWVGEGTVYRFPGPLTAGRVTLERVSAARLPAAGIHPVTGADVHPCGDRVLVRTYDAVLEYRLAPGARFEAVFQTEPRVVARPNERQGEAVAYLADGRGFVTASEGKGAPVHAAHCR